MRYLTFEISRACDFRNLHPRCPIGHPERYRFGDRFRALTDDIIVEFWKWARFSKDFRGIILFHNYNEPTLHLDRIKKLMWTIHQFDPKQPFQLFTNNPAYAEAPGFDLVKFTDYDVTKPEELDNRIAAAFLDPASYEQMQRRGWCGRGYGWELLIDNGGNWDLCCADWRCEESVGNIFKDDWDWMLSMFEKRARGIRWHDRETYDALPAMCRRCMTHNFNLHRSGACF